MQDLNFFDYIDDDSLCGISQVIRNNDKVELRKMLIDRKKRRNAAPLRLAADNRGWTAVHVAASRNECIECLQLLLRYSEYVLIDLHARSFEGKTALFVACEEGCEENVLLLLKEGSDANAKTLDGTSPLHVASAKGYVAIVRYLLENGASVNEQDWQGFTSLHLATLYNRRSVCETLLENKADPRTLDSEGNLALHLACQRGHSSVARLLLQSKVDVDVDAQNHDGMTPLMLAVQNCRNEECVRYLVRRDASTGARNKQGFIALQYAAIGGNVHILRTLLDRTAVVDVDKNCFRRIEYILKNAGIFYPLVCCALNSGSVDCLAVLLESGLPKKFLEAPYVENSAHCTDVFSPLAYLSSVGCELADETFDALLRLLLRHEILFTDALKTEWLPPPPPSSLSRVHFVNPYANVFNSRWPDTKKFAYLATLNEYDVTIDYCLRCYNDNTAKFRHFHAFAGYSTFYKSVLDAVRDARVDAVGFFLSHSRILEPDQLCYYLVVGAGAGDAAESQSRLLPSESSDQRDSKLDKIRSMYLYLVGLKPTYYKRDRYPGAMSFFHSISTEQEFSRSTLQQLCRNVIRQQLRGDTLLDNLRNFHSSILGLPLPTYLKDYLLFKNQA